MIPTTTLTERQRREREYYDQFVTRAKPRVLSFNAVRGRERRPWNPYWCVAELVSNAFSSPSQRLLDFGCGPGSYAIAFANLGYDVSAFDVSPVNIRVAESLAEEYGLANRTHFTVGVAERLDYPSGYFDVIVGIDILHHVQIQPAIEECLRVLKPGGFAVFKEPNEAPLFDALRNSRLGRRIKKKEASFEHHVTADERKLSKDDLRLLHRLCRVEERRFRVLSRLEALMRRPPMRRGSSVLEMIDYRLLRAVPPLGALGGNVVLVCRHR